MQSFVFGDIGELGLLGLWENREVSTFCCSDSEAMYLKLSVLGRSYLYSCLNACLQKIQNLDLKDDKKEKQATTPT